MNITFVLRDSEKKDGTKTIRCYIQHNGRAYYNTKYSILEGEFKGGRVKETRPNSLLINSYLINLRNEVEGLCLKNPNLPASSICLMIGKGSIHTFLAFFENFIKDCENGKIIRSWGTVKNYKKVKKAIEEFPIRTDFDCINREWYDEFTSWLRNGSEERQKQNENTVGSYIKVIKTVMREAFDRGVTTNLEFQKKYFKQYKVETDSVYLNEAEIKKIIKADLKSFPHLQVERDRFLIQYYFIQRFGDTLRFNKSNFYTEKKRVFMRMRAEKTEIETIIPVSKVAYDILVKYKFDLPATTNQQANRNLKEIGRVATITELVKVGDLEKPKFNFITTHTARRSGATNLFLQGCPDKIVMDMGGWKSIDTFRKYIKLSKLESAKKAMEFDFFK